MWEKDLEKLTKDQLIELCNDLLYEQWDKGNFSNHFIKSLLREISENNSE